ncbi:MAG TPA: ADP-ribosylglycohydrolase family protein, partial [Polyangiaceae bacterium]|nr:ADP-ribosylglycohydrolase family protein [Polyangiaceae bacterium]
MKTTEQLKADGSVSDVTSGSDSTPPSPAAAPNPGLVSRVVGCVLGAAIGDALGHPTEFINSFDRLFERFGPQGVTGYELYWEHGGKRFAPYTDDTQMAELVLRNLLWARESSADLERAMTELGVRFARWATHPQGGHRAPGNACLSGSYRLAEGVPWHEAGGAQAGGCGSVMRVYPMGLLFSHESDELERWAVAQSKLTHRAPIALAACASMARGTSLALRGEQVPRILEEMVAAAARHDPGTA